MFLKIMKEAVWADSERAILQMNVIGERAGEKVNIIG
jgi:hypothetical protein